VIRAVTRYISACRECGIDGPDEWPTIEQAEVALDECPCLNGNVITKPPSVGQAFRSCDEATHG
jgi:hypothetical protein